MTNRQEPAEQLLDVLVYAPLGLAMEAAELLPKLADKGRRRMGGKVTVARMVGEMAVRQGQRKASTLVDRLRAQQRVPDAATAGHRAAPGRPPSDDVVAPRVPRATAAVRADAVSVPDVADLAIPGYDTLSASQVVPRLEGLSDEELGAIRGYEESHRARKTVLTRIDQHQDAAK